MAAECASSCAEGLRRDPPNASVNHPASRSQLIESERPVQRQYLKRSQADLFSLVEGQGTDEIDCDTPLIARQQPQGVAARPVSVVLGG